MIPLTNVTDARSGAKAPHSLCTTRKQTATLARWSTGSGGGVLGHTNNGDKGRDTATFHYRSEIVFCTRAANQHVILKG